MIGKEAGLIERGKLFTKIVASCLRQDGATAVYTDGAVFHPGFYNDVASLMKKYDDALRYRLGVVGVTAQPNTRAYTLTA